MIRRNNWQSSLMTWATAAATLGLSTMVYGDPTIRNAWVSRYGGVSSSYANLSNGCNLCHVSGTGSPWNAYGWNLRQQIQGGASVSQAFTNVESMNSDGVSTNNLAEILASAQPGWTAGPNNTYFFSDGSTTPNQMPATLVAGTYDPVVLPCPADTNGDHLVNVNDLLVVINGWGPCPAPCPPYCAADINDDCSINVSDLLAVINAWGPCP